MNKRQFLDFIKPLDRTQLAFMRKAISKRIINLENERRQLPANSRSKSYNENLLRLLNEDWSFLFDGYSYKDDKHYVYLHGDPEGPRIDLECLGVNTFSKPIYVGQGSGHRAYSFVRGVLHTDQLGQFQSQGSTKEEIVHIIKTGLSEKQSRELEAKLILFFGIKAVFDKKKSKRRDCFNRSHPSLLNAQYEPIPDWYQDFKS